MAAIESLKTARMSLKLNAGASESGKAITRTVNMPALVKTVAAADIMAIKNAAAPVLNYPISSVEHTVTTVVEEG